MIAIIVMMTYDSDHRYDDDHVDQGNCDLIAIDY